MPFSTLGLAVREGISTGWCHHHSTRPGEVKPLGSTEAKPAAHKLSNSSVNIRPTPSPKKKTHRQKNRSCFSELSATLATLGRVSNPCCARERLLRAPGEMLKVVLAPGRDKKQHSSRNVILKMALTRFWDAGCSSHQEDVSLRKGI